MLGKNKKSVWLKTVTIFPLHDQLTSTKFTYKLVGIRGELRLLLGQGKQVGLYGFSVLKIKKLVGFSLKGPKKIGFLAKKDQKRG